MNLKSRNEVVALIENGTLQPDEQRPHIIKLPKKYKRLSKGGGEVITINYGDQKFYLFFTFRGVVDNYSGFVYLPNEQVVEAAKDYYIQVEIMRDEWYYCASN